MPQKFESCRHMGGKIRTKSMTNGKYMHICIIGGKSFGGEVKKKKSKK